MRGTAQLPDLSRRQFLVSSAATVGGLLLGFHLPTSRSDAAGAGGTINAYIRIGADETITLVTPCSEMGQGVHSALPQILAEELMVDWERVQIEQSLANPAYNNPMIRTQGTYASVAVKGHWMSLRRVGATAREMLIAAAAQKFSVSGTDCVAAHGKVTVKGTGQSATYGELAAAAALIPPPVNPPLIARENFRLIGKPVARQDIPPKVNGSAVFGMDVRLSGLRFGAIRLCPTFGGTLASYGSPPAGMTVVPLSKPNGEKYGVVVVAPQGATTFDAIRAARHLKVNWIKPAYAAKIESAAMAARAQALLGADADARLYTARGDLKAALAGARTVRQADYAVPYVAHACIEPLNCTALVRSDSCEIWAPTQAPSLCVQTARGNTGLSASQITVHTTFLGNGLGRKSETDFIQAAVIAAKALPGTPVQVTWSREEDFTHDFYRPAARARLQGGLDAGGNLIAWSLRLVCPSIAYWHFPVPSSSTWVDFQAVGGTELPYANAIPNQRTDWVWDKIEAPPVGYWRAVWHSHNAFFVEGFLDELAEAAGRDPVEFRRALLLAANQPRWVAVLDLLAEKSGWSSPPPAGRARGVALHQDESIVGEVAEVSVNTDGIPTVHRVTCVVDCGQVVNPDTVEAQMESSIVHGLGAAMWGEMTFSGGEATRKNFNTYRMLRMKEMPEVDTYIIDSTADPTGIGEAGVPPIAPAVVNALARLTGQRYRTLPLVPNTSTIG